LPNDAPSDTIPAVQRTSLLMLLVCVAFVATAAAQSAAAPLTLGDRVFVRFGSDSVRSDSLTVDAEGRIFLPRAGALDLHAVPARDVPSAVRTALATIYRNADATVVPLRRVTVTGEVRKPGVFFLPTETSLRDAVAVAQGATEIGNPDRLTLVRNGAETTLVDWITRPEGAQPVASGDLLVLARESWIKRNVLNTISTFGIILSTFILARR